MTISKTNNGKWRVRVDIGANAEGKRVRKTGTFDLKREAVAAEHEWSSLARKRLIATDTIELATFIEEVFLPFKEQTVRANTLRGYKRDIFLRIIPMIGHYKLSNIDKPTIQRLIDACESHKVATNTRTTLRVILSEAEERGFITSNPARLRFAFPKRDIYPEEHNGIWLTSFDEIDQFIQSLHTSRYKLLAALGLNLGLRKGEIFGLDWQDVDFSKGVVSVARTYVEEEQGYTLLEPKTKASRRTIPMRKSLIEFLEVLEDRQGAICKDITGKRANPSTTTHHYTEYLKRHNLPYVTVLNMRHSFATSCLTAGIDITKVSKLLGHTSINTTVSRYIRFTTDDLIQDFQRL